MDFQSLLFSFVGIFGVPKEKCAEQYSRAVSAFSASNSRTSLREIHFVDIDRQMVHLIASNFKKQFPSKSKTSPIRRKSLDDNAWKTKSPSPIRGGSSTSSSRHTCDTEDEGTVFDITDRTSLYIKVGDVAVMEGSAVVCPQDKFCYSFGKIADAIKERLGNMEQNMPSVTGTPKGGFPNGKVIPTKIGKFTVPWEYILHAVCPKRGKEMTADQFEGDLKETIRNVFQAAENLGLKSIVCPLLGAGKSGNFFFKTSCNFMIEISFSLLFSNLCLDYTYKMIYL